MLKKININLSLLVFILFVFLVIFRHFEFFINPRFWAEEGSVYFIDAYENGISSIFHPHLGYFSFIPNVATYLATLVSLEYAPLVTTTIAFFIQIIPFFIIFISNNFLTNTALKKLLISSIVLFVSDTGEIWLNTITSQFHFVVISFLIFLDSLDKKNLSKYKLALYSILVLFGGLSGVPTNVLAPIFLFGYFFNKNKYLLLFFFILLLTTSLQLLSLYISANDINNRFNGNSILKYLETLYRIIFGTLQYPFLQTILPSFGSVLIVPLVYLVYKSVKKDKFVCFFFCVSFYLTFIFVITSLNMSGGSRYFYAPNVIFVLGLFYILISKKFELTIRMLASLYVFISILVGLFKYPIEDGSFDSKKWPKWKEQIKNNKNKEVFEIKIYPQWPNTDWKIIIKNKQKK